MKWLEVRVVFGHGNTSRLTEEENERLEKAVADRTQEDGEDQ